MSRETRRGAGLGYRGAVFGRREPRGNLVAVLSNGTAILGLGNLGALAAKKRVPVTTGTLPTHGGLFVGEVRRDRRQERRWDRDLGSKARWSEAEDARADRQVVNGVATLCDNSSALDPNRSRRPRIHAQRLEHVTEIDAGRQDLHSYFVGRQKASRRWPHFKTIKCSRAYEFDVLYVPRALLTEVLQPRFPRAAGTNGGCGRVVAQYRSEQGVVICAGRVEIDTTDRPFRLFDSKYAREAPCAGCARTHS